MIKRTLIVVGFLIIACETPFKAQTPSGGASQEQPQAAALWSGWWKLNLEKSTYQGMPRPMPPEGQVRQYTLRPDGFWVESVFTTNAAGLPTFIQRVFRLDRSQKQSGFAVATLAEFQATGKRPADPTATYRGIDRYTVERLNSEPGGTVRTTTRTVSKDGKTFTLTIKGTNPQSGQPLNEVELFERIAD
jgi:hypothetical protein